MTEGQGTWDPRQLRCDSCDRTAMTVKLWHDMWDMTSAMTLDLTSQTGQCIQVGLTGQPAQVRQERIETTGCQGDWTVGTGELGT